jgi:hemolysin activation/secretion protein
VGLDYKHFDQTINLAPTSTSPATTVVTPITYYPLSATYGATWQGKRATTELNAGVTFHLRGVGSSSAQFNNSRSLADSNFLFFHGDLSHTHELPAGFQLFGKVQGQIADQPLLSGEQYAGGGQGTVRGYLEAEQVGDSGLFGTVELRSPPLLGLFGAKKGDWRIYAFADAGWLKVIDALTGQKNHFDFASYGVGSRLQLFDHFDGSVTASLPQLKEGLTKAHDTRVTFQAGLNY